MPNGSNCALDLVVKRLRRHKDFGAGANCKADAGTQARDARDLRNTVRNALRRPSGTIVGPVNDVAAGGSEPKELWYGSSRKKHTLAAVQGTPSRPKLPGGTSSDVHVPPPFVVDMIAEYSGIPPENEYPTAVQSLVFAQDTLSRLPVCEGAASALQVAPPFVVATIAMLPVLPVRPICGDLDNTSAHTNAMRGVRARYASQCAVDVRRRGLGQPAHTVCAGQNPREPSSSGSDSKQCVAVTHEMP
jgi:hypothetical protein